MIDKLKIPLAFLITILIWTSTPLAIQWSSSSAPLSSVLVRMLIGVMFCLSIMGLFRIRFAFDENARRLYVVGGLTMFLTMSLTYIAAQSIPSGWISIIFGLSPIVTGILSLFFEPEDRMTIVRSIGICLGLGGLILVFQAGLAFNTETLLGVSLLLVAMLVASIGSVIMRHLSKDSELQPMQITSGGLVVAIPFFALSAFLLEPSTDVTFSNKELLSILYLGLIGT
ncbi:MAG: DMT family transporter, partial [Acidiferrobacterales bacterium]|nr:DMT family transporter [Acidiferrobacterales bacterium]